MLIKCLIQRVVWVKWLQLVPCHVVDSSLLLVDLLCRLANCNPVKTKPKFQADQENQAQARARAQPRFRLPKWLLIAVDGTWQHILGWMKWIQCLATWNICKCINRGDGPTFGSNIFSMEGKYFARWGYKGLVLVAEAWACSCPSQIGASLNVI